MIEVILLLILCVLLFGASAIFVTLQVALYLLLFMGVVMIAVAIMRAAIKECKNADWTVTDTIVLATPILLLLLAMAL
jgi:hypothetical protein